MDINLISLPVRNLHNPTWPEINLVSGMQNLSNDIIDSAKRTSVFKHINKNDRLFFEKLFLTIKTNKQLEDYIIRLISTDDYKNNIEKIFHLIEIWGGHANWKLYTNTFDYKKNIEDRYKIIVSSCVGLKDYTDGSLLDLYHVLCDNKIDGIGVAYITKHVRYWTWKLRGSNALPIFDSIISNGLYNEDPKWDQMIYYWKDMIGKSKEIGIPACEIERQYFNIFRNNKKKQNHTKTKKNTTKQVSNRFESFCKDVSKNKKDKNKVIFGNKQYGLRTNIFGEKFEYQRKTAYQSFSIIGYKNAKNKDKIKKALDNEFVNELSKTADYKEVCDFLVIYNHDPKCLTNGKLNEKELIRWFNAHAENLVKIINENK